MARKKKRIDPRIKIAAAVLGVAVVGGGGFAAWKLKHKDPAIYVNAGDQFLRQGNLNDALAAYSFVATLRPTDPQAHLRVARVHDRMRDQDFWYHLNAAVDEYTRAEELQPNLKDAWQGLLDTNMAAALATTQNAKRLQENLHLLPERFGIARDAADHILALDPADYKARSAVPILTINLWLQKLTLPMSSEERRLPVDQQPTENQRVEGAIAELTAIIKDHPENADLPSWIAQARIEQGVRIARQAASEGVDPAAATPPANDPANAAAPTDGVRTPEARAAFAAAAAAFDEPLARLPRNATLWYKKFDALTRLGQADRDPEALLQYQANRRIALDNAQSLVTPADGANYLAYKMAWAGLLASMNEVDLATAEYKRLLDRPATAPSAGRGPNSQRFIEDVQVRVLYGRLLMRDPARRDEALAVLAPVPAVAPADFSPAVQQSMTQLLATARVTRARIEVDQYATSTDPAVRDRKRKDAQAELDAVRSNPRFAGEPEVLKVQGLLQLVTGASRDAIQTLGAASDRLASNGAPPDLDLSLWEAEALANGGVPVQAIKKLEDVVRNPPGAGMLQPHLLLAKLYLQQQDFDDGRRQVAWLSEQHPDEPQTLQLQIDLATHDGDAKAIAELYGRLPERTPAEQVEKAAVAVRTHNPADAERLNELLLAAHPGDPATALRLAGLYGADGKKGRANEVLQRAMDLHPESRAQLKLATDKLNGASSEALRQDEADQIASNPDPMVRAVAKASLAGRNNDLAKQTSELEQAHAIQPDNVPVLRTLFRSYLNARAFDKAEALLPRIADLDADQFHGLLSKFQLALSREDNPGALVLAQRLAHDYPQFAVSWASLGDAMRASGQLDAACQQYAASLDRQGNAPAVIAMLVDCQIRLGRVDDARRTLGEARRKFPDVPIYRKQLIEMEMAYGDPEGVLGVADEGVNNQPDVPDNWQVAVRAYAATAQRRTAKGDAAGAAKLNDHVRQLLADALKRWPDNAGFAAELGDLQSHDGTDAGVAAAAETFRALGATPTWQGQALPDVLLGRMYLQVNRPEQAEAPLRRAIAVNPKAMEARVALADSLYARHENDEALRVLAPARDQAMVRAKYVDLLIAMGRPDEAETDLLNDLRARPNDPTPGNLLARVYAVQGKFDDAQQVATRTLKADPGNVGAYFVRGTAEAGRTPPDLDGAIRDLTTFRSAVPNNVLGRMALARTLLLKGDPEGASRELEAAVQLTPEAREPRLLLAKVYLAVVPPRSADAERVVTQALSLPAMAHDVEVQRVAAAVYLKVGADEKAVTSIRDAMANATDQRALLDEYLNILLATKHNDALLEESSRFANDPQAPWTLFDLRGRARAGNGDLRAAATEFATALDRAGTAADLTPSLTVASHITAAMGLARAVELVRPRSENGTGWKVVLASCYSQAGDKGDALAAVESALPMASTLPATDQLFLSRLAAELYMTAAPPQPDRAVAQFQAVLKVAPDDLDALNNVACLLDEQVQPPRPAQALPYTQHAMDVLQKRGQENLYLSDTYGWTLILNDRLDEGIDVLHQIVGRADFPDAHYHLAMGYIRKGSNNQARRELDAALAQYRSAQSGRATVDTTLPDKIAYAEKRMAQPAAGNH